MPVPAGPPQGGGFRRSLNRRGAAAPPRCEWDSNPRRTSLPSTVFETVALARSATAPEEERAGFEPASDITTTTALAGQRLQPLVPPLHRRRRGSRTLTDLAVHTGLNRVRLPFPPSAQAGFPYTPALSCRAALIQHCCVTAPTSVCDGLFIKSRRGVVRGRFRQPRPRGNQSG